MLYEVLLTQVNLFYMKYQMQIIRGKGEPLMVFQVILVCYIKPHNPGLLMMNPAHGVPVYLEKLYILVSKCNLNNSHVNVLSCKSDITKNELAN